MSATEKENLRDMLLRPWMTFQRARRDYLQLARGEYYNPRRQVAAYDKMLDAWNLWCGTLLQHFGSGFLVEYDVSERGLIFEIKSCVVMGIMYFGEY